MRRRLPNLNQIRVFEAVARNLSFKDAANELFVTQAAVSHQIKALEQDFGRTLFHRQGRKVSLTEEAQFFLSQVTPALEQIADAAATLKNTDIAGTLNLSMGGYFANRVVRPHLYEFKAQYPNLQVNFSYSREIVDFGATEFDAAIVYGPGSRPGLLSVPICNIRKPVSAPGLQEDMELPIPVKEIARLRLATTKGHSTGWIDWFAAAGIHDTSSLDFIEFCDGGLAFDFAATGEGVALISDLPLIEHELVSGTLVIVNPLSVTLNYGIYLFYPQSQNPDPNVLAFARWLQSVAARLRASRN
jgi:LysR family transcriptional regulator, glycine cleavage system transcriptional activator